MCTGGKETQGKGKEKAWNSNTDREMLGVTVGALGVFLRSQLSLGFLNADGSAGDSGQWRVLICATGSHQQCHPATRRPTTEGKSRWDQSPSLSDFQMLSSLLYFLGICSKRKEIQSK